MTKANQLAKPGTYERLQDEFILIDYPPFLSSALITQLEKGMDITVLDEHRIVLWNQYTCAAPVPLEIGKHAFLKLTVQGLTLRYYEDVERFMPIRKYSIWFWFLVLCVLFFMYKHYLHLLY